MTARTVCGCTPPSVPPTLRDSATIAQGLADAAEHLDALALGISRAACELRMRPHGKDGAPCQD